MLGRVTDAELAALMAGAAAFCLPSLYEGFGLTALEAMACGAPVVVSDRGALPEVVGDAGVIVAPSADGVRSALARILRDPELAGAPGGGRSGPGPRVHLAGHRRRLAGGARGGRPAARSVADA